MVSVDVKTTLIRDREEKGGCVCVCGGGGIKVGDCIPIYRYIRCHHQNEGVCVCVVCRVCVGCV